MIAEIVNLRRARKAKLRNERETVAAENRARHGRTRAERLQTALENNRSTHHLEAHRIDRSADPDDGDRR